TAQDVDGGSTDACGIASIMLDNDAFTCLEVGTETVTLTVTDNNGKVSTCTSSVTIEDDFSPIAICNDLTVQLDDSGNGSITAQDVDGGSTDACGLSNLMLNKMDFDCSDVGTETVTLTLTDNNGKVSTCTSNVLIEDKVAPQAQCNDLTLLIGESGNASITTDQVNNGSTDACGIQSLNLDNTMFNCNDNGLQSATLTVTDMNGNTSTCSSEITVTDDVAPQANCQDVSVELNTMGNASITTGQINNNSTDICGISGMELNKYDFTCADAGTNTVILTVTDNNNLSATCTAVVTVEDNTYPTISCRDITIQLDNDGMASITPEEVVANTMDNCSVASLSLNIQDFGCDDLGTNEVKLTATDNNGRSLYCYGDVTVELGRDLPDDFSTTSVGPTSGDAFYNACEESFDLSSVRTSQYNYKTGHSEFTYVTLNGDFTFSAEVKSISSNGIAGIMVRESGSSNSTMAWVGKYEYTMGGGVKLDTGDEVLSTSNGRSSRTMVVTVSRSGNIITFSQGRTTLLKLRMNTGNSLQVGMMLMSVNQVQATASFENVEYEELGSSASIQMEPTTASVKNQAVQPTELNAWPNPSSGQVNLELKSFIGSAAVLRVYDLTGKVVYNENLGMVYQNQHQIDLSDLEEGVYIISIEAAGQLAKSRVVIN
ncbi:MAG: T9SS type A sorting domain-containing protein, partial [Bacteroidota bacterium]